MFIAKRKAFLDSFLYYVDDTSWSDDRSKAKKFNTEKEAIAESDRQKLYEVMTEEV